MAKLSLLKQALASVETTTEQRPSAEDLGKVAVGVAMVEEAGGTVMPVGPAAEDVMAIAHPADDPDYEAPDDPLTDVEDEMLHDLEEEAAENPVPPPTEAEATEEVHPKETEAPAEEQTDEEIRALAQEYRDQVEAPAEPEPPKPKAPSVHAEMLVDAKPLREFLSQVGALADEVRVHLTRDGWNVKAVDPAHVAFVDVTLPAQRMEAIKIEWLPPPVDGAERPEEVEFGIDVEKLLNVVKASVKGPVWIRYDEDKNRVEIAYGAATRTMGTVDTAGMSDPKIPKLELPAVFTVPGEVLWDALEAAGQVSDHIRLTIEPGDGYAPRFTAEAQGDVDSWNGSYQEEVQWVHKVQEKATSLFPLDYLTSIVKPVKGYLLTVHLGNDFPIRIDWSEGAVEGLTGQWPKERRKVVFDGATKGTYLCAPRIESQD